MITATFRHERPRTIEAAVALLAGAGPGARVLSGGTWLVPEMVSGAASPSLVVDLRHLDTPAVRRGDDGLVLAAHATYGDVLRSPDAARIAPLLVTMAAGVTGGAQLRNLATIAGSACYATPASDAPGCLVALGARMRIAGSVNQRELPSAQFFRGPFTTALGENELLSEIVIPDHTDRAHGYVKVKHCAGSWPIAAASALALADGTTRVVLGAVSGVPLVAAAPTDRSEVLAGELVERLTEPWTDALADGAYRRAIAPTVVRRSLARLAEYT